jgi:hypothetical protein
MDNARRSAFLVLSMLSAALVTTAAQAQSPSAQESPSSSAGALEPGSAQVVTTGDLPATIELPQAAASEYPTGDGSFDLLFQDAELNTLLVTLDVASGQLTDAFVGVGLPGTSIYDETYFADFFRTNCEVAVSLLNAAAVQGTITCDELENASSESPMTIALEAQFHAVPEAPSPSPTTSPPASAETSAEASPVESPAA